MQIGGEAVPLVEEPVQAGDTDVVQAFNVITHQFGRAGRFFGDRQVRGPGGEDEDAAVARRDVFLSQRDQARDWQVLGPRNDDAHRVEGFLGSARDQQRRSAADDLGGDRGDLGRCFA